MSSEIDYKAVLQDLIKKRDALTRAIEGLRPLAGDVPADAASDSAAENGEPNPGALPSSITHSTFLGMSMPDAIKALLGIMKKDLAAPEIRDALLQGGYKSVGTPAQMYPSVFTTLKRLWDKDIVFKRDDGKWGLAEWYPNRKKPVKPTKDDATAKEAGAAEIGKLFADNGEEAKS